MFDIDQIFLRLMLAAVLSGIIGYEREARGRAAGLRTTILVGVGSCLIMLTSINIYDLYKGQTSVDPARIAAQVVSGIGFLGAGTILHFRASVRGLTTAAGLWAVSGVGLAVGSGFFSAALISSVIIFVVLFFLSRLEEKIRKELYKILEIEATGGIEKLCQIRKLLDDFEIEIGNMEIISLPEQEKFNLILHLKLYRIELLTQIAEAVTKLKGINIVKWL